MQLGWLGCSPPSTAAAHGGTNSLVVQRNDGSLQFSLHEQACRAEPYSLESDLFSRHAGLLETARMWEAGVIVCGCGSVGGVAALDLARSGVGRFLLIDPDLLAIENLCRHPCGLADVGAPTRWRQWPMAFTRSIPGLRWSSGPCRSRSSIPPWWPTSAQGTTLMMACADSRRADRHAARLATALGLPFLAIGLWERAFAGEIFYSHPDCGHALLWLCLRGPGAGLEQPAGGAPEVLHHGG